MDDIILNIKSKRETEIYSVGIYNSLGQLVLVHTHSQDFRTVAISGLKSGNYFIKINTDKGTSDKMFLKK